MRMEPISAADAPGFAEGSFPKWRGREPLTPHLDAVAQRLAARHPDLAAIATGEAFAALDRAWPDAPVHRYNDVPRGFTLLAAAVPAGLRAAFLGGWLIAHLRRFDARFAETGLPGEFALHYADHFHRILDQIDGDDGSFADPEGDVFRKDAWLARMVMVPAFAQIWWPRSGLSARMVLAGGWHAVRHVFGRCGGRRPYLEGHTHDPVARAYWNAAGWAEALRLAALALPAFPQAKGVFGTAWFYDPAVLEVSPRIGFAQELQVGQGAVAMRVGTNEDAVRNATATSAERRNRHRDGSYVPCDYAMIWARRDLIARYGVPRTG